MIGVVVLTVGELVFPLSYQSIVNQSLFTQASCPILVLGGISPMRTAYNEALDWGWNERLKYLFVVDGDVILYEDSFNQMLDLMDTEVFLVTAKAFDVIYNKSGPGGIRLWNMEIMRDKYRYRPGLIADINLVNEIESSTSFVRKRLVGREIGFHHPIWTPDELWMKLRFSLPKYTKIGQDRPDIINKFQVFLNVANYGLRDRQNKVLKVGNLLFRSMMAHSLEYWVMEDKDIFQLVDEWEQFKTVYNIQLNGKEVFCPLRNYNKLIPQLLHLRFSRRDYEQFSLPSDIGDWWSRFYWLTFGRSITTE